MAGLFSPFLTRILIRVSRWYSLMTKMTKFMAEKAKKGEKW